MKHIRFIFFPNALVLACLLIVGCKKKTETIIEKEIETVYITKNDTTSVKEFIMDSATTFILTRHAEPLTTGSDPGLSAVGQQRAQDLARLLSTVSLASIYTTNYNRTRETSDPTATAKGLPLQTYTPANYDALADQLLAQYKHKIIYVVGHSNTTNELLNSLVGAQVYGIIPAAEYDNLYIVNVTRRGNARVTHIKYGQ